METKDNRARVSICIAFVIFAALIIALFSVNSVQKYELSDLTPLGSSNAVAEVPSKALKLDIDTTKDYGVIGICFRNIETGDKYFVDFSYADGYTKDLASALPAGEYKVKLVNAGKLGKTKAMPKTITVGTDDTEKVISFK